MLVEIVNASVQWFLFSVIAAMMVILTLLSDMKTIATLTLYGDWHGQTATLLFHVVGTLQCTFMDYSSIPCCM